MIAPKNGDSLLYHPSPGGDRVNWLGQPLAATVVHAFNERMVNLVVHDALGITWPKVRVQLLQNGDVPQGGAYASWPVKETK